MNYSKMQYMTRDDAPNWTVKYGQLNRVAPPELAFRTPPRPMHPHAWQEHNVYGQSSELLGIESIREVPFAQRGLKYGFHHQHNVQ